ncbi:MAG: hypothetical protein HN348_01140 [Proteobacteria bacterium]|nr:hypothetical protein [Pseudomonadota bacterium]
MYQSKLFALLFAASFSGLSTAYASEPPPSRWPSLDGRDVGVRTWETTDIDVVKIDMTTGRLRLAGGTDLVTNIARIDGPSTCGMRMYTEDRILYVSVEGDSGKHSQRCVIELAMSVPAEIEVDMEATNSSVELWHVESKLSVRGRVPTLEGAYVGQDLQVLLSSGKVRLNGLRAAPHVHTGRGNIQLRFDERPTEDVYAHSDKGRVSVSVPRDDQVASLSAGGMKGPSLLVGESRTMRSDH